MGRAHSAVPLAHLPPDLACVEAVERCYTAAGLPAVWRLARVDAFAPLCAALAERGYSASQATCVQIASLATTLHLPAAPDQAGWQVRLEALPFEDWRGVYLGPSFDAQDAASRIAVLARGRATDYAVAYVGDLPVASGALSCDKSASGPPLASVHGMRTAQAHRGQGLAGALLRQFAQRAQALGCEQWFLQVELANTQAQRVYAKLGFETAWVYDYWRKPSV